MIHISIIVPFKNAERYIANCIEGLFSQRYPAEHYEIIMVDNNSSDMSVEIVKESPRIHLVHEERRGAYAARNRGVLEARGEIIAFTDPDCVPSSDWLNEITKSMIEPQVGIVVGNSLPGRDSLYLSMLADYEDTKSNYIFSSVTKALYCGCTRNMAVRKSLFDQIGPFVERSRGSDTILVHRCINRYSCDLVRYSSAVQVRHLEICRAVEYFRKLFVYGRSCEGYCQVVNARPLSSWERWLIFRKTIRKHGYSAAGSLLLFGLLSFGLLYWFLGRMSFQFVRSTEGQTVPAPSVFANDHK